MIYMGGKTRLAKWLIPVIIKDRKPNQTYAEPFCGGLGSLSEVHGKRIAGDINPYLIAMWKGVKENRRRRTKISKAIFDSAKKDFTNGTNENFDDFQIGWIGSVASFRGRMFKGFGKTDKSGRQYLQEHIRSIRKQAKGLGTVDFYHCNYWQLPIPKRSIIYCDPPYSGTDGYLGMEFDHDKFWEWCRMKSLKGHQVFVSEYNAPDDFICIWVMPMTNRINHANTEQRIEKLFVYKPTWKRKMKIKIPKLEL